MAKGGKGGDNGAAAAQMAEQQRQSDIRNGTAQVNDIFGKQFNDDFYNGRKQAYLDYANPQLADQYAEANKQLTYSLDRNGTLDSTARTSQDANLSKLYDTNQRAVADQALGYENDARNKVNTSKTNLIGNLGATGDVSAAVNGANANATALSQPDVYSPLSQLFSTFTNGLSTQAQLEKTGYITSGAIKPAYNTGLFSGNTGSAVKVY